MQRLPDTSLTAALASGGRAKFGWGVNRHMLADLFDAIQANTKATGNWRKGKVPGLPTWPRPKTKPAQAEQPKPASVAEIYSKFQRR